MKADSSQAENALMLGRGVCEVPDKTGLRRCPLQRGQGDGRGARGGCRRQANPGGAREVYGEKRGPWTGGSYGADRTACQAAAFVAGNSALTAAASGGVDRLQNRQ